MSSMFAELLKNSRHITRDQYAADFGGVADDVVGMVESDLARRVVQEAREVMETAPALPDGSARLRSLDFGRFDLAPELVQGLVAAVDGTAPLPLQAFSAGQALCVGVGSLSHRRPLRDSLHCWSSRAFLDQASNTDDFLAREEQGLAGVSQTAYLRYFELRHALEIAEPYLFLDGTLVYEWLTTIDEGLALYRELFSTGKKAIGVMKSIKGSALLTKFARALQPGEAFVVETLADHLLRGLPAGAGVGEMRRYARDSFVGGVARSVLRGVFKPVKKAFGFEVHADHLDEMLRLTAADAQLNHTGREVPYLLNRIEEEVRGTFRAGVLRARISDRLARESEELVLEETDDRGRRD